MNTNRSWMKLLMAATMLTLLLAAACAGKNELQSTEGQALVEQGNAYMTCVKHTDLGCAYALMSPFAQAWIDVAERATQGVVDLEGVLRTYGPRVSDWTFDRAQFSTRDGRTSGPWKARCSTRMGSAARCAWNSRGAMGPGRCELPTCTTGLVG